MAEPTRAAAAKMEPFMVRVSNVHVIKEGMPAERVKRWSVEFDECEKERERGLGERR
jgi:hypothetical protein